MKSLIDLERDRSLNSHFKFDSSYNFMDFMYEKTLRELFSVNIDLISK